MSSNKWRCLFCNHMDTKHDPTVWGDLVPCRDCPSGLCYNEEIFTLVEGKLVEI